jgi:hypothetical protein
MAPSPFKPGMIAKTAAPVNLLTVAPRNTSRHASRALVVLLLVGGLIRIGLAPQQALWGDELFSLATATGHSLEQAAAEADPAQGDYVQCAMPVAPSEYSRYLDHDHPPASLRRLLRAVFLSETSPPLYYVLLYGWTRLLGSSDVALRLFSVPWALACVPAIWSLARRLGGRAAQWPVVILFTFSPVCVYYSTEGRMYSLVWFWAVWMMWSTVALQRKGFRPGVFLLWVAAGALGLLTHYFFAFVWVASLTWLLLTPGRLARGWLIPGVVLVGLLVLPWYSYLPASVARWRVTSNWLYLKPAEDFDYLATFLGLFWSYFAVVGYWGVRPLVDGANLAVFLILACLILGKASRSLWSRRRWLLWLWACSPCLGVALFDLWRGTYAANVPRYVLAGLPGALLLVGFGLGRLRAGPRVLFLSLIVLLSLVAVRRMYLDDSRCLQPLDDIGHMVTQRAGPSDLVLVHSAPSGVVGVARYLDRYGASAKGIVLASWVGRLGQWRVADDMPRWVAGRRQVIFIKVHDVAEPAPEENWLRDHTHLASSDTREEATLLYFVPKPGQTAFPSLEKRSHD